MNEDVSHDEVRVDLSNPNTSHTQVVDLVPEGSRVLDVGCGDGALGRALVANGCQVSGIEVDAALAARAKEGYDEVVVADLESSPASEHFAPASFDAVVLADVLQHLRDPGATLRDVVGLLAPGGSVVVTLPNVAHGSMRLALLQGRWRYTPAGLLDETHVRFFTRAGVLELFEQAELHVDELRGVMSDPLDSEVELRADRLPPTLVEWVRHQPDALVYQFVARATAVAPDEGADPAEVVLRPVIPEDSVRVTDQFTQRLEADLEERHRVLTIRDHVIGLEAAASTAQYRADRAERQLRGATKRLARKNQRIKELTRELQRLRRRVDEAPVGRWQRLRAGRGPR